MIDCSSQLSAIDFARSSRSQNIISLTIIEWVKDGFRMSLAKHGKSKMVAKSPPEKVTTGKCRDLVILGLSFSFTIIVAGCLLLYIEKNQCKSEKEIESIVQRILEAKSVKKVESEKRSYERKRGYLDKVQENDSPRKARSVHDEFMPDYSQDGEHFQTRRKGQQLTNSYRIQSRRLSSFSIPS